MRRRSFLRAAAAATAGWLSLPRGRAIRSLEPDLRLVLRGGRWHDGAAWRGDDIGVDATGRIRLGFGLAGRETLASRMSAPSCGALLVTMGSTLGSKNIGRSRVSSASSASLAAVGKTAPLAAACRAAASKASGGVFRTNFWEVRLLYGPLFSQKSFVYVRMAPSVAGSMPSGFDRMPSSSRRIASASRCFWS